MGLANTTTSEGGTLDLVITNVTIIDPILGVIKADVGVKTVKLPESVKPAIRISCGELPLNW